MIINILNLFPKETDLFSDIGNVKTIVKRCEWRGIETNVINHEAGDEIPDDIDMIIGGGGQSSAQSDMSADLIKNSDKIRAFAEKGVPVLAVCGMFQLFGEYFIDKNGQKIDGLGIFDMYTKVEGERFVGNATMNTEKFGEVAGYEDHTGKTYLKDKSAALGTVVTAQGNNGEDGTDGMIYKNCIGTYFHGPVLPKNPLIADFLISKAIEVKTGEPAELKELDDSLEKATHKVVASRPR